MFKELIALAFMLTILIPMTTVRAYDWYPPGNIDGLNYFNITNFVYGTFDYLKLGGVTRSSWPIDTSNTTEQMEDVTGAMVSSNTETRIIVTYDDGNGKLDFIVLDMANSTHDVWIVVDNGTFMKLSQSVPWANLSGIPALGNTSIQMWVVIDNNTFIKWTQQIPWANLSGVPVLGNSTHEVWMVVDNGTFQKGNEMYNTTNDIWLVVYNGTFSLKGEGNTTHDIWIVVDNGTFQYEIGADCSIGNYMYGIFDNGTIKCRLDVSGGSGVGLFMVTGDWITPNESAGGKQNINISGLVNATGFSGNYSNIQEYLRLIEIGVQPSNPPSGSIKMYVEDRAGRSVWKWLTDTGIEIEVGDITNIVRNAGASTFTKGTAVYLNDSIVGGTAVVERCDADLIDTPPCFGILMENIASGDVGRIMIHGILFGVDTSSLSTGNVYVSQIVGELTNTQPSHPALRQTMGEVVLSDVSGIIYVSPTAVRGNHEGTNRNAWIIGDGNAGDKTVQFTSASIGNLTWNPTSNRIVTIPDSSGTMILNGTSQINADTIQGSTKVCIGSDCRTSWPTSGGNTTAEIQTVPVGGEVGGTIGAMVLDNDALDDQYIQKATDDTKSSRLTIFKKDANAFTVQSSDGPMAFIADTFNMVLWTITLKANVDNTYDVGTTDRRFRNVHIGGYISDNIRNTTAAEIRRAYDYTINGTFILSSWNATYSATSADVAANRTAWFAQLGNSSSQMSTVINETGASYWGNCARGTDCLQSVDIGDIDDEDIEGDLNTYVDIAGDEMAGNLNMTTYNITTSFSGNRISNNGTCWLISGATGDLEVC